MNLRIKPRKRIVREKPEPLAVPVAINQCWSMDFMHNQLSDGRSYRLFNVIDDFNREALAFDIELSLPPSGLSGRWIKSSTGAASLWPFVAIAAQYISGTFIAWAERQGIRLEHIQPGNPQQHAYIERYNRTVRYDCLSHYLFESIAEVENYAADWMWTYNHERPNTALGSITPKQKSALVISSTSERY